MEGFRHIAFADNVIDRHGLSNKLCYEHLLKETKSNTASNINIRRGGISRLPPHQKGRTLH